MALAEYRFVNGNRLESLLGYQEILKRDNNIVDAHLFLAVIYMQQHFYDDGFREMLNAIELDSSNFYAYIFYKYFSVKYEVPKDVAAKFEFLSPIEFNQAHLDKALSLFDVLIEYINSKIASIDEEISADSNDFIILYNREISLRFLKYFEAFRSFLIEEMNAIFERIRQEEERVRAEAERVRLEEEQAKAEAERILQEEELARAEAERIRLEEESRVAKEKEDRERALRERYSAISDKISGDINTFIKNKGVLGVLLLTGDSYVISSAFHEETEFGAIGAIAKGAIDTIKKYHTPSQTKLGLVYWVLEFEKGLIALRVIDDEYLFVTVADSSANFGVLRYSIEKMKEIVEKAFTN